MSDAELIKFAKRYIREKRIRGRFELQKMDRGLYNALRQRKLLNKLGLKDKNKKHRDWESLTDKMIISYARRLLKRKGIERRKDLEMEDSGLNFVLRKRRLLNLVFAAIESSKNKTLRQQLQDGLTQAADAMEQFGGSG